jgi:hypothetical protein
MLELTIKAKDWAELNEKLVAMAPTPTVPAPRVEDFSLQTIVDYLRVHGWTVSQSTEDAKTQDASSKVQESSSKRKKVIEPTPAPEPVADAGTASQDVAPTEKKAESETPEQSEQSEHSETKPEETGATEKIQQAIKLVMGVYGTPAGRKLSQTILKKYNVKNFNLIPHENADELLKLVQDGVKALAA